MEVRPSPLDAGRWRGLRVLLHEQQGTGGAREAAESWSCRRSRRAFRPAGDMPSPTSRPGMGTILYPGGAAFRVWAPFAPAVFVAGTFNQWSATANPFASEGNGYWSVEVTGAGVGDEYQFVIPDGGNGIWHKNPYASEVVNSFGNAIIHDPNFDWTGDDFVMPPWNELVIYEMHVGTFVDVAGCGPGTFETVIPKLAYLADLGINAIEIMPVAEFPMSLSWGYNPAQPFSVETAIGGPGPARVRQGGARPRHRRAARRRLQPLRTGRSRPLALRRLEQQRPQRRHLLLRRRRAHDTWGDTRPDYGRPEVRQYIRDNALFWLDKYRWTACGSTPRQYPQSQRDNDDPERYPDGLEPAAVDQQRDPRRQPWKSPIAEDLQNNGWITRETSAGGAGFGSQWDAAFVHPIRDAIIAASDADRDMTSRERGLGIATTPTRSGASSTPSHTTKWPTVIRGCRGDLAGRCRQLVSRKRSTLGAAMVFTAPGIPMIFQGQEFLEDKFFQDSVPLDWTKRTTYAGIHALYRDLIRLRRNWFNQTRGLGGQSSTSTMSTTPTRFSPFTVGPMAGQATMSWWWRISPTAATTVTCSGSHAGTVARPFQQRLAGLQPGLRQSAGLRHGRGPGADGTMPCRANVVARLVAEISTVAIPVAVEPLAPRPGSREPRYSLDRRGSRSLRSRSHRRRPAVGPAMEAENLVGVIHVVDPHCSGRPGRASG